VEGAYIVGPPLAAGLRIELTEIIAWENASSKFNRALRIPSQGLWKRRIT